MRLVISLRGGCTCECDTRPHTHALLFGCFYSGRCLPEGDEKDPTKMVCYGFPEVIGLTPCTCSAGACALISCSFIKPIVVITIVLMTLEMQLIWFNNPELYKSMAAHRYSALAAEWSAGLPALQQACNLFMVMWVKVSSLTSFSSPGRCPPCVSTIMTSSTKWSSLG